MVDGEKVITIKVRNRETGLNHDVDLKVRDVVLLQALEGIEDAIRRIRK